MILLMLQWIQSTASGFRRQKNTLSPRCVTMSFPRRWMRKETEKKWSTIVFYSWNPRHENASCSPKKSLLFWLFFAVCRVFTRKTPPKEKTSNKTSPMFKCVFFFEKWNSLKCYSTPELQQLLIHLESHVSSKKNEKPSDSFHLSSARSKWCSPLT